VARAEKESGVAKLMTELCGMGAPKPEQPAEDPEADFNAFERAILDNLRAVVVPPTSGRRLTGSRKDASVDAGGTLEQGDGAR